jgi:hypothetical protein
MTGQDSSTQPCYPTPQAGPAAPGTGQRESGTAVRQSRRSATCQQGPGGADPTSHTKSESPARSALFRPVLGDDHPDTLRSATNLAITLHALGDHQAAAVLDAEVARHR